MRLAYPNGLYQEDSTSGGNRHIGQFISNAVALGHEVWTWPGDQHPASRLIPATRVGRLMTLRRMDAAYIRVEWSLPAYGRWAVAPYRQLIGSPVIVWEFNTVPEYGYVLGHSEQDIQRAIQDFRFYGRGCDLAICVSRSLADYVRDKFGLKRVLVVPNGSDPDLFRPDVSPVRRVQRNPDQLNIVWIGSADLAWHNFDLLAEAARLLWDREDRWRWAFHIIGQGFRLMGDMPPNIYYYGPADYDALPHWLAAMDVGLCLYHPGPADYCSPLKVFDYMASGLTVVGTFQPQLREVFDQLGQPDLLVPSSDPKVLADVLSHLASNRARVRSQGDAGRRLVSEFYNWRRAVQDTFHEIQSMLDRRKKSRIHSSSI
ncbi:MAG: glycosyltransferase [Candidatus Methylomirabilales bacterium]